jgi:hypothetical protein
MPQTLVRTFDRFDEAMAARLALIEAGFQADALTLQAPEDDGGPAEGNFVAGNGRAEVDDRRQDLYDVNFSRVAQRSVHRLIVQAQDDAATTLAARTLERFAARDPDAAT